MPMGTSSRASIPSAIPASSSGGSSGWYIDRVPATVADAVRTPFPCPCNCHEALSLDERAAGITALYRFDDAMRGWGQTVIWDLAAPTLWRLQQQLGQVSW